MQEIIYDNEDCRGYKYTCVQPDKWQEKYVGAKYSYLTFITPVYVKDRKAQPHTKNAQWLAKCDCGNVICKGIAAARLRAKNGHIVDCGCNQRQQWDDKYIGKRYGYLTVLERDDQYKKEHHISTAAAYYKCQCDCGKIITTCIISLNHNKTKSCGCLNLKVLKERPPITPMIDITGQRFGKLVALEPFYSPKEKKGVIWWHCKCDCGKMTDVRGTCLRNGDTTSCGCSTKSHGEHKIEQILQDNKISYKYNVEYFSDLVLPKGGIGRYDFVLLNKNQEPIRLIEYDGEQHFYPVERFGGEEEFIIRQQNDKIKNDYAKAHNLPLVRIPYTEKTITLDLLLGEKYLINK